MDITSLAVWNARVHTRATYQFGARVTVLIGPNGSGKTTLLEALHIALQGASFRGSDSEFLRQQAEWWRVDVGTVRGVRSVKFDSTKPSSRKRFEISSTTHYRLPVRHKIPVVVFEPDDLRLLHGSPARRRRFIDTVIAQSHPHYPATLRRYERALRQRNRLLKQPTLSLDDTFVWDIALAEYGSQIVAQRQQAVGRINQALQATYRSIAGNQDRLQVRYQAAGGDGIPRANAGSAQASIQPSPAQSPTSQALLGQLHQAFGRDRALGYTTAGPHRHDVAFIFNGAPAAQVASRGEVRSLVLALKFIEVDMATASTGREPIILLDDVFAELDDTRQRRLAEKCRHNQMFITSTQAYANIDSQRVIRLGAPSQ